MKQIQGGVTAPQGFLAAGVEAGIKKDGKDVALLVSEVPAVAAAVFTTNEVKAAPVRLSMKHMSSCENMRAVVVNSGNANACTGTAGEADAMAMCRTAADVLGIPTQQILVASTGVIGVPLPISRVITGIGLAADECRAGEAAGSAAAEAIRTTDTMRKEIAVTVEVDGRTVTIGGMAKGSGMIHPNMATMLGFITTDARVPQPVLQALLKEATDDSFHMISVDGDTSTNDTVIALANGLAETGELTPAHEEFGAFAQAFSWVCEYLAKSIVRDGEGATKFLEIVVDGAKTVEDGRKLAKSILTSSLVKTAFFGEDANWGRVLAAMGYAGVSFDENNVSIAFASSAGVVELMKDGSPLPFDEDVASKVLHERDIEVQVRLREGTCRAVGWGCDLSYEYVRINGDYRT